MRWLNGVCEHLFFAVFIRGHIAILEAMLGTELEHVTRRQCKHFTCRFFSLLQKSPCPHDSVEGYHKFNICLHTLAINMSEVHTILILCHDNRPCINTPCECVWSALSLRPFICNYWCWRLSWLLFSHFPISSGWVFSGRGCVVKICVFHILFRFRTAGSVPVHCPRANRSY